MSNVALDLDGAPDKPLPRDVARQLVARPSAGRPIELTEDIAIAILEKVAEGSFLTVAAGVAGVSEHSVYGWLQRAKADASQGLDTLFVRFANAYAQAKQLAEANAVAALQRGGDGKYKDWRAQAWWLERRHKDRWSLPKEGASNGITLTLSGEALAALSEALRVASATQVNVVDVSSEASAKTIEDDPSRR